MDTNAIYFVLGVIATIIVGYWGIRYSNSLKPIVKLAFFKNSCISLFNSVAKDLDELEIRYKGNKINENLLVYKGTFFNSGNTDIDKSIIHKPLTIVLPEDYEWKKAKIIDKSNDIIIAIEHNKKDLTFEWDILKESEFFSFESIIEYNPAQINNKKNTNNHFSINYNLTRNIQFTHRINNLKNIDNQKFPSKPTSPTELVATIFALIFIFITGTYWGFNQLINPKYTVLYEINFNSEQFFTSLHSNDKNEITILDSSGNDEIINIDNTPLTLTGKIRLQKDNISYISLIFGSIFILLSILGFFTLISDEIRKRTVYKKVKYLAEKYSNDKLFEYDIF